MELQKLMDKVSKWSDSTFGKLQRTDGIINHLKKEVVELSEAVAEYEKVRGDDSVGIGEFGRKFEDSNMEFADCFMLLIDAAHHHGLTARQLIHLTNKKLKINKKRNWGKPDENGVVEHIKE